MYAVIKTGGKQYKVSEGEAIYIEKLDLAEGSEVEFEVVAGHDGKSFHVGSPLVESAKVTGKVLKNGRKSTWSVGNKRVLSDRIHQMVGAERGVERVKKHYYGEKNH